MKYINVKNTDLKISKLIMGTARMGLCAHSKAEYALLDRYLASGANTIDTAHVYSNWIPGERSRSERFIGEWLKNSSINRENIVLISKGGHPEIETMEISRMSKKEMSNDLEGSLHKLGVDYIDIYLYHRDDTTQPVSVLIDLMESFVKDGKIRYYGCSNWSVKRIKEADEYCKMKNHRGFVMNQCFYNVASAYMNPLEDKTLVTADETTLNYHKNSFNIFTPYMALCSGFFTKLKAGDTVNKSPYNTNACIELATKIDKLCVKYNASISQILLGYILSQNTDFSSLFSVSTIEQLEDVLRTTDIKFEKRDFLQL